VTGANNSARPMPRCQPPTPAGRWRGLTSHRIGTEMNNSPYSRQAPRSARRRVAVHAGGNRGKNRLGRTSRKRGPPTTRSGASRVAYAQVNNAALDLASSRAWPDDPSRLRAGLRGRPGPPAHSICGRLPRQIAWGSLRRFSLTAQLLDAGAYGRKVVGSTRSVHGSSSHRFVEFWWRSMARRAARNDP
jgi:hypothetical protein